MAVQHLDFSMCRIPLVAVLPESASSVLPYKPLHVAARDGDVRRLLALIKTGAAINEQATNVKWTALHMAAAFNRVTAVAVLLHYGADTETRDADGDTPLITAASLGYSDVIQQLITKADIMHSSQRGETALHAAADAGFDDIASLLLARGGFNLLNARTSAGLTARDLACSKGHRAMIDLIDDIKQSKETLI